MTMISCIKATKGWIGIITFTILLSANGRVPSYGRTHTQVSTLPPADKACGKCCCPSFTVGRLQPSGNMSVSTLKVSIPGSSVCLEFVLCCSVAVMTQTIQTNGVQPLSKTWELSLYELQRTPQVTIHSISLQSHVGEQRASHFQDGSHGKLSLGIHRACRLLCLF